MIELKLGRIELTPAQAAGFTPTSPRTVDLLPVLQHVLRDYQELDALLARALECGWVAFPTSDVRANLLPKIATLKAALARAEGRA